MRNHFIAIVLFIGISLLPLHQVRAEIPSFDCSSVREGSIEALICKNESLALLDKDLSRVYREALSEDSKLDAPKLKVEQRGWIKGRNECWKSEDQAQCVKDEYQRRIAELQATYRLLSPTKTVFYACENNPANEVVVNYFATTPKTVIAERGDSSYLLFKDSKEEKSQKRYQGRNETLIEEGEQLKATFSFDGPQLLCKLVSTKKAGMHPSWDRDGDGLNDCEKDGSCDHTIDYSKPRIDS